MSQDVHQVVGLRFRRSAARVLRNIAHDYRGKVDVGLYFKAAESAEKGELLEVGYTHRSEVEQMVALFVSLGVGRPTIEDLRQPV